MWFHLSCIPAFLDFFYSFCFDGSAEMSCSQTETMVLHVRRTSTVSRFSMARFPPSSRACQEARRVFRLIRESLSVRLTDNASITKHTKRCGCRRSHDGGTILSTLQLFHSYKADLPKVNLDNDDLNRDPNLPRVHG